MTVTLIPPDQDYRTTFGDPSQSYTTAGSQVVYPRVVAVVNGVVVNVKSCEIECNTHGTTDSGSITLGIAGNPDWSLSLQAALGDGAVIVEVYAAIYNTPPPVSRKPSTQGMTRVFFGLLQVMNPVFHSDEVTFKLQSLAALMTGQKITTQFGQSAGDGGLPGTAGYTTVQFVKYVASLFGLQTNIDVPGTPALMTQVYAARQWVGVKNVHIADMLIACAETDNADWFVDPDGVLNYVQPSAIGRAVRPMKWGKDLKEAAGEHSPQFSKTIHVIVTSWTRKTRTSTTTALRVSPTGSVTLRNSTRVVQQQRIAGSTAAVTTAFTYNADGSYSSSTGFGVSSGGSATSGYTSFQGDSGIEVYKFARPNLTPSQCNAYAIQMWNQISRFEYTLSAQFALTPELLGSDGNGSVLKITTLYQISGLPWSAFNNATDAGALVGQQPSVGSPGPLAGLFATNGDTRFYYQRRFVLHFGIGQDEAGSSEGLWMDVSLVNHPLPNSGANSAGTSF